HQDVGHDHAYDHNDVNRHDAHIKAVCLTIDEPILSDALNTWLETLIVFRGEDFLRIKGIFNVVECNGPIIVHGVQHIFHPAVSLEEWPSEDRRSRVVFITRDIEEGALRGTLEMLKSGNYQHDEMSPMATGVGEVGTVEEQK
ncbi:MAG: GTP-binding protein, partial [Pseudomonadota bacterium]|nr:GTP-binding protein [Pseudomonadota bacterium]